LPASPAAEPVPASRAASFALLVAAVLFLSACGTGTHDPKAPTHAFTKADRQKAKLVDVQQADVPPDYRPHGSQLSGRERCAADLSGLTMTAVDRSTPFVAKGVAGYVLGEVDVYESPAQAATAFRRVTSSTRLRCLLRIAHSALSHFDHGRIAVEAVPLSAASFGSRIVGRRFAERWRETGGTHVETTDDVYVLAGRTFVILSFFRDKGVFPVADEARTVRRVAARALGAKAGRTRTHPGGNTTKGE
jgi:hypothetical protein